MRDTGYQLLKAYKAALNGNVSYNSNNVPILSRIDSGRVTPYIQIGEVTSATDLGYECKDIHSYDCTILIDVYTFFPDASGSPKPSLEIADAILQLIGEGVTIDSGFHETIPVLESSEQITEVNGKQIVIRRLLRMRNQLTETTSYV